jgi:CRP/FNR family transcriptional regulator, dissimilatory nitrate respiration regulator
MQSPEVKAVNKILKINHRDREVLQTTALMSGLSPGLSRRIMDIVTVSSHEARDMLFREGTEAECFYAVISGYVRLFRLSKEGREADIGIFGPGEIFGECAMFLGSSYTFNAQAAESVTLARFDMVRMRQLMREEPELAMSMLNIMARHLNDARENVANDRLHTAPQRVANYLLELSRNNGNGPSSFRLPFQKSLLAGKLGLAPEALSRAFSLLRNSGVSIRGRMVQIIDTDALRKI